MQVVQVHLQPFQCILHLKCLTQPEIAKKFTKTPYLKVEGHSRSSTLSPIKSLSLLLVMISSIFVSICNRFHATRADSGKITTFREGSRIRRTPVPAFLNLGIRDLDCWNLRSMLKISYAGCLGLSPAISSQFNVEMCAAFKNCKKFFTKNPFWGFKIVQDHRCW